MGNLNMFINLLDEYVVLAKENQFYANNKQEQNIDVDELKNKLMKLLYEGHSFECVFAEMMAQLFSKTVIREKQKRWIKDAKDFTDIDRFYKVTALFAAHIIRKELLPSFNRKPLEEHAKEVSLADITFSLKQLMKNRTLSVYREFLREQLFSKSIELSRRQKDAVVLYKITGERKPYIIGVTLSRDERPPTNGEMRSAFPGCCVEHIATVDVKQMRRTLSTGYATALLSAKRFLDRETILEKGSVPSIGI